MKIKIHRQPTKHHQNAFYHHVKQYQDEYLVVVYKETNNKGFIITAFLTSRLTYLMKKEIIWNRN